MKSDLQIRAERTSERFGAHARKPIVIEFAGVPKAGKTSTISQVQSFFKRCGFRVQVVVERASVCPIRDKKHSNFNIWTACTTLSQILEHTQEPPREYEPQILILDRGLFDSICWLTMMDHLSRIRQVDRDIVEKFLLLSEWRKRISGVIVMVVSPEDAMNREQGFLPIEGEGSIMNREVLRRMLETTKDCVQRMKDDFQIYELDTSSGRPNSTPKKTAEHVADIILNLIEEQLQEDILHIPKSIISSLFSGEVILKGSNGKAVWDAMSKDGKFKPREEVEENSSLVQALPVVVVRNNSGDVLRLRRRERDVTNRLHEKIVIWAGGHVRQEDKTNGDPIIQCALRELTEELRLSIDPSELQFLGAIYADAGNSTSKHVALVFEWQAKTDDVAVTLSSSEFFERRGTSLSGTFVSLKNLAKDVQSGKISEVWSTEILGHILHASLDNYQNDLFR